MEDYADSLAAVAQKYTAYLSAAEAIVKPFVEAKVIALGIPCELTSNLYRLDNGDEYEDCIEQLRDYVNDVFEKHHVDLCFRYKKGKFVWL